MTTPHSSIRKAVQHDRDTLVDFNQRMALETESITLNKDIIQGGVQSVLDDANKGFYLVTEVEGEVQACLMITNEWSDWRNGMIWWIQSVYVHPDYRRQGLYKSMYTHLQNAIQNEPEVIGIRLYVEKDNRRAQQTYSGLGMKKTDYLLYEAISKR
mgnify:CR=1 FL=1